MIRLNNTPKLFLLSEIAEVVATLQAGELDGWTYVAINADGSAGPYASIKIFDEDGELVGFFCDG